jgi:hypothetical protein
MANREVCRASLTEEAIREQYFTGAPAAAWGLTGTPWIWPTSIEAKGKRCSSTSFSATARTSRYIRISKRTFGSIGPPCWRSGGKTIFISSLLAARHLLATCPKRRYIFWMPVTSPSRRIVFRLPASYANSCHVNEAPLIDVHLVKSTEAPGGVGEPGTSAVMPAVANAIFAATGKRIRKLPIDSAQLK